MKALARAAGLLPEPAHTAGLRWLAPICLYLISPLLLQPLLDSNWSGLTDLYVFQVLASMCWLGILWGFTRDFRWTHSLMIPLYFTTAVDLFLITFFDTRLSASYIGIIITDNADAGEFFSTYWPKVLLFALLFVAVVVFGYVIAARIVLRRHLGIAIICLVTLISAYSLVAARSLNNGAHWTRSLVAVVDRELSAPVGVLYQTGLAFGMQLKAASYTSGRSEHRFDAKAAPAVGAEIYVLVIGESARPHNWSMFGYERDTTPRLRREDKLVPLPNVLSTAPQTSVAVPSMMSLQPISAWTKVLSQRSIVSAFGEAGFKTYWFSTQEADSWAGIIPQIAREAQQWRFFDHARDAAMLDDIDQAIDSSSDGARRLIVIHTKGSHFEYERRYPKEFARFQAPAPDRRSRLVAAYDNSVLYTDWFLAEILSKLRGSGIPAVLIYASDHGQNLLDTPDQLLGHSIGNEYDLASAAFVWVSDGMATMRPHALPALRRNANKPLSLSDLPHSLLDLANIEAQGWQPEQSIFRPDFVPQARQYMARGELRTYADKPALKVRAAAQAQIGAGVASP
jgi:glucan phosphoethanolaminetransferase (alkaline phosphatase superfamily)